MNTDNDPPTGRDIVVVGASAGAHMPGTLLPGGLLAYTFVSPAAEPGSNGLRGEF